MIRVLMLSGLLAAAATAATAQTAEPAPSAPPAEAAEAAAPLALEQLDDLRGGQGVMVTLDSRQTLTASSSGNQVNGETVGSGAITLNPGAFSGFDGIGNFVINTGHNNTLQGGLTVNVITTP